MVKRSVLSPCAFRSLLTTWFLFLTVPAVIPFGARAQWPEHRGNSQRTAFVEQSLEAVDWQLSWCVDSLTPPKPAWPPPARASLWQELPQIEARVTDDHADSPILAEDSEGRLHVLVASSSNDRMVSIDPDSGQQRWELVVGAPIRFAPSTSNGIAYFGSDDGFLRAVRIADGHLIWEVLGGPGRPWIYGNQRLMSPHPIRTSVLCIDGRIVASAGLFPSQGVYALALDASDGSLIWRRRLNRSPQGYSVLVDSQRFVLPEGRSTPFIVDASDGTVQGSLPSPGGSFCMLTPDAFFAGPGNQAQVSTIPLDEESQPRMQDGKPLMLPLDGRATAAGCGFIWIANRKQLTGYDTARTLQQDPDAAVWTEDCGLGQVLIASGTPERPLVFVAEGPSVQIHDGRTGQQLQSLSLPDESEQIYYLAVSQRKPLTPPSEKAITGLQSAASPATAPTATAPVATLVATTRSGKVFGWSGYGSLENTRQKPAGELVPDRTAASGTRQGNPVTDQAPSSEESGTDAKSLDKLFAEMQAELPVNVGLVLVSGERTGYLAERIAGETRFQVVQVLSDPIGVQNLQSRWQEMGIYGHRATVRYLPDGHPLPFTDGLLNAVLAFDVTEANQPEWLRVLSDGSGRLFRPGEPPIKKPIDYRLGAWRHQYASPSNEASTVDEVLSSADSFRLQWFGGVGPRNIPDRHLRGPSPLAAGATMVIQGEECLIGVDPANGIQRWHVELPSGSTRLVTPYDCGYSALTPDGTTLYTATARSIFVMNALTGELSGEIIAPNADFPLRWGYVAEAEGWLFASLMKPSAPRLKITDPAVARSRYSDQDYTSVRPMVCSRSFHCLTPDGEAVWSYHGGVLIHSTLSLQIDSPPADGSRPLKQAQAQGTPQTQGTQESSKRNPPEGSVVFVESRNRNCLAHETDRIALTELMEDAFLVCLDSSSGELRWRQPLQWPEVRNILYVQLAGNFLTLVTSSSDDQNDRAHYSIRVHDLKDGRLIWQDSYPHVKGGLYHGEQVHHPVILQPPGTEPLLVCEPYMFELSSGKRFVPNGASNDWALQRPGHSCGSLSGCGQNLFFRANNPTVLNLFAGDGGEFTALAPSRPGCWINMIPATGKLLIPEASASCVCNFPLQTSMAFVPNRPGSGQPNSTSKDAIFLPDYNSSVK
jgi:outer membrane protein assembly factor BamB